MAGVEPAFGGFFEADAVFFGVGGGEGSGMGSEPAVAEATEFVEFAGGQGVGKAEGREAGGAADLFPMGKVVVGRFDGVVGEKAGGGREGVAGGMGGGGEDGDGAAGSRTPGSAGRGGGRCGSGCRYFRRCGILPRRGREGSGRGVPGGVRSARRGAGKGRACHCGAAGSRTPGSAGGGGGRCGSGCRYFRRCGILPRRGREGRGRGAPGGVRSARGCAGMGRACHCGAAGRRTTGSAGGGGGRCGSGCRHFRGCGILPRRRWEGRGRGALWRVRSARGGAGMGRACHCGAAGSRTSGSAGGGGGRRGREAGGAGGHLTRMM